MSLRTLTWPDTKHERLVPQEDVSLLERIATWPRQSILSGFPQTPERQGSTWDCLQIWGTPKFGSRLFVVLQKQIETKPFKLRIKPPSSLHAWQIGIGALHPEGLCPATQIGLRALSTFGAAFAG